MNIYNHFLQNKYTKWYKNIITKALFENRDKSEKLFESHHILPKAIFPEFQSFKKNQWNEVLLTYREHFICHWLLPKMFDNKKSIYQMENAIKAMQTDPHGNRIISSWQFEIIKKYLRKPKSNKTKQKMSLSRRGKYTGKDNPNYGNHWSDEKRKALSDLRKANGKSAGENNSMFGKKREDLSIFRASFKGSSWYNNGITSKRYHQDQVPDGWIKGRLSYK